MAVTDKILIVDDHLAAQETLKAQLAGLGYHLFFASSGKEALGKIEQAIPDLVLLDVMMPELDGFEVCRRLKADLRWRHIPIILITALNDRKSLVRGLDAGGDDFLSKPVNQQELRARVRSMLRIKHQYDALEKRQRELEASLHLNRKYAQVFAQHAEALEVMHDAGKALLKNLYDSDMVLNLIADVVLDLIPEAGGCLIHGLKADDEMSLPMVFQGKERGLVYPRTGVEGLAQQVIRTEKAVYVPDASLEPYRVQPILPSMRSLMVTPLIDEGDVMGALTIFSEEIDSFTLAHQHVLTILAGQAAVALEKARSLEEREQAEVREVRVVRDLFQRYVSPSVAERLLQEASNLSLGGTRQAVSVMFADIRGFSTFSENLPPEQLVDILNQYLAIAVNAILSEEGTLDKFMGDAVMAFFNAPLAQADHDMRAVRAALRMQQTIERYNRYVEPQNRLSFGIGIHTGEAVVGNIGTSQQMNFTVVGDTVNLAKRLQENAEGGQILLSETTYEAIKHAVTVRDLGLIEVKGRLSAEQIFELHDIC